MEREVAGKVLSSNCCPLDSQRRIAASISAWLAAAEMENTEAGSLEPLRVALSLARSRSKYAFITLREISCSPRAGDRYRLLVSVYSATLVLVQLYWYCMTL